jgi:hypothetical protein
MDKVCLCGKCGKINEFSDGGLCVCGADYWLEKEDLKNPDLKNYAKSIINNLGLSNEYLLNTFFRKDNDREALFNKVRRIIFILFDYDVKNKTINEVKEKIEQILTMSDFKDLTKDDYLTHWVEKIKSA